MNHASPNVGTSERFQVNTPNEDYIWIGAGWKPVF